MQTQTLASPTLVDVIWKDRSLLRNIILVIVGSMLLTLSAKVKIPLGLVPITMQSFVVLALGMVYGWKMGTLTVLFYLAQGAAGLPVFTGTPEKGIGYIYMMGVTGGYLVGFVFAAALCGWLAERGWDRNWFSTLAAMILGNLVIYSFAMIWFTYLYNFNSAITDGLLPFLFGDFIKIVLAVCVIPGAWKIIKK